jgi:DNA-binding transcriptional LysR family regulator
MNLDLVRSFLVVAESGSLSRAAARLRVSQSTLTRQVQSLEQDLGGLLLERGPDGVALTSAGYALKEAFEPLLRSVDDAVAEVRRRVRGQSVELRVGYIGSAATDFLNPALAVLRERHPEVRVHLFDRSPGEQLAALRRGELDLALLSRLGSSAAPDVHVRRIGSFPLQVALPASHRFAKRAEVTLKELRTEAFVGAAEGDLPGFDRWLTALCRKAGFRPRILTDADGVGQALSLVLAEHAVAVLPFLPSRVPAPGIAFVPLVGSAAHWDLVVAWQRGRIPAAVHVLIGALSDGNARR